MIHRPLMLIDGEKDPRPLDETFDYVIVGSGAAGATAARVLADVGARIAIVEEGPALATADFEDHTYPALRRMFRDMGLQFARGRAFMPVIQGTCLGGSTVINSAIVWRIPDDVWEPWKTQYGLGVALPLEVLHRNWDQIEHELRSRATAPDIWGENNRRMDVARQRLDLVGGPMVRYEVGCRGSARCTLGCPYGAKQSMLITYLPYALEHGATIYTSAHAHQIVMDGARAAEVRGWFHLAQTKRRLAQFRLRARRGVLIAASAVQTPGLLARSGVRSRHLGAHFQAHPGVGLAGIFDEPVGMWSGATQGYEIDQHRVDGRYKIETLSLAPEVLFARLPGVGGGWLDAIGQSGHMSLWVVQLRAYAEGVVRMGLSGTDIRYDPTPEDMRNLRRGLRFAAEMLFASGARQVLTGIHGLPQRLTRPDQARLLEDGPADPACYTFALSHLFGTARMSVQPADGVVGPDFAVHGTEGLYVVDSSIFPTNLGVNPQHAIMGIAMHAARQIAARPT